MGRPGRRSERGMVTAETVMVLPFLVIVATVTVWAVSLGVSQARLADAAADAARMLARGDDRRDVERVVAELVPGASLTVTTEEARARVQVARRSAPPLVPGVHLDLSATSVAVIE